MYVCDALMYVFLKVQIDKIWSRGLVYDLYKCDALMYVYHLFNAK